MSKFPIGYPQYEIDKAKDITLNDIVPILPHNLLHIKLITKNKSYYYGWNELCDCPNEFLDAKVIKLQFNDNPYDLAYNITLDI